MNRLQVYASHRFHNIPKNFSFHHRHDEDSWWNTVLDPQSDFVTRWNHIFLVAIALALFLDPLYFYLPYIGGKGCISIDIALGATVTVFRTITDLLFCTNILLKFRIAFVAPNSRVFGRGELVRDRHAIARRYLRSDFVIDLTAMLPLPQIVIWFIIPKFFMSQQASHANHTVSMIALIQLIPRLFVIFPLNRRIMKTAGFLAKTAWLGSAYTLLAYLLFSHIIGASWYLMALERQDHCWTTECTKEMNNTKSPSCRTDYFDCSTLDKPERNAWLQKSHVIKVCDTKSGDFEFGIFADAFTSDVATSSFSQKYLYCLWWGLKSLSSYGQNLETSTYTLEIYFSMAICIGGLILFSYLIGKMQTYVQSTSAKIEQWRVRRRDTEEWMRHRQLPEELRERVRRFVQYKWLATRGVDEDNILQSLPLDLRRQIQRHLCLGFVRRVPFFAQMDQQLLDAICERLYSSLNTKDTYLIREDDPVNEMFFIIRGRVESSTTNGGRTGFYNSITLKSGDFCGEELLTWALMPVSSLNLPLSTRTVKCLTEVEAFALRAEDLKFVASQFRRLHSKKLQHAFRYYSHQWRTWGACFIQAAWRRYVKRKRAMDLAIREGLYNIVEEEPPIDDESTALIQHHDQHHDDSGAEESVSVWENGSSSDAQKNPGLVPKFSTSSRRVSGRVTAYNPDDPSLKMPKLFKPQDPDFSDH